MVSSITTGKYSNSGNLTMAYSFYVLYSLYSKFSCSNKVAYLKKRRKRNIFFLVQDLIQDRVSHLVVRAFQSSFNLKQSFSLSLSFMTLMFLWCTRPLIVQHDPCLIGSVWWLLTVGLRSCIFAGTLHGYLLRYHIQRHKMSISPLLEMLILITSLKYLLPYFSIGYFSPLSIFKIVVKYTQHKMYHFSQFLKYIVQSQ